MTYLTGSSVVVVVLIAWVAVQRAWGAAFGDARSDPDVLAVRGGHHGCCGCSRPCDRPGAGDSD
ncbi:MAG TPA: hypothetical protein VIY27_01335, partial [Myxococcota bacterium]